MEKSISKDVKTPINGKNTSKIEDNKIDELLIGGGPAPTTLRLHTKKNIKS